MNKCPWGTRSVEKKEGLKVKCPRREVNKYPWGTRSVEKRGIKRKNVLGASRTRNRLLRKQVLYPLSYEDVTTRLAILTPFWIWVKSKFRRIHILFVVHICGENNFKTWPPIFQHKLEAWQWQTGANAINPLINQKTPVF